MTLSKTEEIIIGKCKYIVTSHYKKDARETAEDKLFRFVSGCISDAFKSPQIGLEQG